MSATQCILGKTTNWALEHNPTNTASFHVLYIGHTKTENIIQFTRSLKNTYEAFAYTNDGCKSERGNDLEDLKKLVETQIR